MKDKLSMRHREVIDRYFENGFDKGRAMMDTGYTEQTSKDHPESVFAHPAVVKEINRRKKKLARKHNVTQDWIVTRLIRLATAGDHLAKYKFVQEDGSIGWDFTGAPEEDLALITELSVDMYTEGKGKNARPVKKFRIKFPDEYAMLMALGRHLGMFTDKVEITSDLASRIQAGREQVYGARAEEETDEAEETLH